MRLTRALRLLAKWGGTLALPCLLVVWALSFVLVPTWSPGGARVWIGGGAVGYQESGALVPPDFVLWRASSPKPPAVWIPVGRRTGLGILVVVPFWVAAVPIAAATLAMWRTDTRESRRIRMGLCLRCGYDRRGLAVGVKCPECGTVPAPAPK